MVCEEGWCLKYLTDSVDINTVETTGGPQLCQALTLYLLDSEEVGGSGRGAGAKGTGIRQAWVPDSFQPVWKCFHYFKQVLAGVVSESPLTDVKKCWICALAVFLCLSAEGTLVVLAWWSLGRCSECFTLEFRGVCLESTETHCFNQETLQSDRHCPCLDEAPNLYQWLQVFPALGF